MIHTVWIIDTYLGFQIDAGAQPIKMRGTLALRMRSNSSSKQQFETLFNESHFWNQFQNVDWLLIGENSSEEMTMEKDCMVLKGKHIKAEMRVTFRLDILKLQRRIAIRYFIYFQALKKLSEPRSRDQMTTAWVPTGILNLVILERKLTNQLVKRWNR